MEVGLGFLWVEAKYTLSGILGLLNRIIIPNPDVFSEGACLGETL